MIHHQYWGEFVAAGVDMAANILSLTARLSQGMKQKNKEKLWESKHTGIGIFLLK
jgi:hypothetical protein